MSLAILKEVYNGKKLDAIAAEELFSTLFEGNLSDIEFSALLMAMKTRGETAEEITGAARSMRKFSIKPEISGADLFDTCGTGGDNSHSFNISTAVAIILNGMGFSIAKHGNRSISSKSGSTDFLEALNIPVSLLGDDLKSYFEKNKFGFLFAPNYHPAMKFAMPVRKTLATRTIFNFLGPLTNPAGTKKQIIGVFSPDFLPIYAQAAAQLDFERVMLYSAETGMDEVSATDPTIVYDIHGSKISEFRIQPDEFISKEEAAKLPGDFTAEQNAEIFHETINSKEPNPLSKILALNTALALKVLKGSDDLKANFNEALEFIHSGEVVSTLGRLATD